MRVYLGVRVVSISHMLLPLFGRLSFGFGIFLYFGVSRVVTVASRFFCFSGVLFYLSNDTISFFCTRHNFYLSGNSA